MQKSEALAHYNNSQAELAKACGVTRSAVHQWPELIPELQARWLDDLTNGELRYDREVYARHKKRFVKHGHNVSTFSKLDNQPNPTRGEP
jgi:hypothetical protein